jgi:hypothetical protein
MAISKKRKILILLLGAVILIFSASTIAYVIQNYHIKRSDNVMSVGKPGSKLTPEHQDYITKRSESRPENRVLKEQKQGLSGGGFTTKAKKK